MLLAGDIGGTKTNLALFDESKDRYVFEYFSTYSSRASPNLEAIVEDYLKSLKSKGILSVSSACFAIAGPVRNGICKATNLPWVVNAKMIEETCGISTVHLINDLEANAYAVEILPKESLWTLYPGEKGNGNRAVVSPGTGLGEAGLYWDGKRHHPFACEGGHCEFGPRDELQLELCRYLIQRFGHSSNERILSGPGTKNLFDFFVEVKKRKPPQWLLEEMKEKDAAAVISQNALNGKCALCEETLDLFVSILGAEAGNCALKFMAFGGVFLGGGIPPKILPKLKTPQFIQSFCEKGRFKDLLLQMPIYVIQDDKASLRGASHYAHLQTHVL